MPSENPSATGRRLIPAMTDGAMHIPEAQAQKAMHWALRNAVVSKGDVLALITQQEDASTFNVRAVDVVREGASLGNTDKSFADIDKAGYAFISHGGPDFPVAFTREEERLAMLANALPQLFLKGDQKPIFITRTYEMGAAKEKRVVCRYVDAPFGPDSSMDHPAKHFLLTLDLDRIVRTPPTLARLQASVQEAARRAMPPPAVNVKVGSTLVKSWLFPSLFCSMETLTAQVMPYSALHSTLTTWSQFLIPTHLQGRPATDFTVADTELVMTHANLHLAKLHASLLDRLAAQAKTMAANSPQQHKAFLKLLDAELRKPVVAQRTVLPPGTAVPATRDDSQQAAPLPRNAGLRPPPPPGLGAPGHHGQNHNASPWTQQSNSQQDDDDVDSASTSGSSHEDSMEPATGGRPGPSRPANHHHSRHRGRDQAQHQNQRQNVSPGGAARSRSPHGPQSPHATNARPTTQGWTPRDRAPQPRTEFPSPRTLPQYHNPQSFGHPIPDDRRGPPFHPQGHQAPRGHQDNRVHFDLPPTRGGAANGPSRPGPPGGGGSRDDGLGDRYGPPRGGPPGGGPPGGDPPGGGPAGGSRRRYRYLEMAARGNILVHSDDVVRRFFTPFNWDALGRPSETTLPIVALAEALGIAITEVCTFFHMAPPPSLASYNSFREPNNQHAVTDELLERLHHFLLPSLEVGPMQWGTGPPGACYPNEDHWGPWPQTDLPPVRPPYKPVDIFHLYNNYLGKAKLSYEQRLVQLPAGAPHTLVLMPTVHPAYAGHQIFHSFLNRQTDPNTPPGRPGLPPHQDTPLPTSHPMTPQQNAAPLAQPPMPHTLPPPFPHHSPMGVPSQAAMPSTHGQPGAFNPAIVTPNHSLPGTPHPTLNTGIPPPPPGGYQLPPYMPSTANGLNALNPTQPPGRRIDVAPKTDEEKLVHGKADIGAAALSALAHNDRRQIAWQTRVSAAKGNIAPDIPMRALQHQLCDRTTRLGVRPALSPENVTACTADITARERQVQLALTRAFHGNEPHESLLKRFQATALPIRCTLMPNLATCGETKTMTDFIGRKRTTEALNLLDSADLIRSTLEAAWPEFDWTPLGELVQLFRSLMGWAEKAAESNPASAKASGLQRLATDILYQGLQLIEKNADVFRYEDGPEDATPSRDICQAVTFRPWLHEKEARIHDMINMAEVFAPPTTTDICQPVGGPATGAKGKTGVKTLNDALPAWHLAFPNVCIFHHCHPKGCNNEQCPHKASHEQTLDTDKLAEFKRKHNLA